MSHIPLDLVEAFVSMARAGSLTRAADTMHVTVSALSHRLRQLEERLDTRVFVRGPNGVSLTVIGRRLFDAVNHPLEDIERALRSLDIGHENFTVSTTPQFANSWLVPRLPDFVTRHPRIGINLQSDDAFVDFEREPVDAALRLGRGGWPKVHTEYLFEEWVSPVASPALLERLGRVQLTELAAAPLLGDPLGLWTEWFARHGGVPPKSYVARFNDSAALLQAAVRGLGIALGRLTLARPLIEAGQLVALSKQRIQAPFSYYLVFPERSIEHPGFLAFRTWLYEQLGAVALPLLAATARGNVLSKS